MTLCLHVGMPGLLQPCWEPCFLSGPVFSWFHILFNLADPPAPRRRHGACICHSGDNIITTISNLLPSCALSPSRLPWLCIKPNMPPPLLWPTCWHYWRKNSTTQNYATYIFRAYDQQLSALLRDLSWCPRWAPLPTILSGILMVTILPNSFQPHFWCGPLFCFGEHNDNLNF